MRLSIASLALTLLIVHLAASVEAAIVADYTFNHLGDDGLTQGQQIPDAKRTQDESGNRYHGFYGGGGNSPHATFNTPSGSAGVDFSQNGGGTVILRDNNGDGGSGSPNSWWGTGNTPTPFFTIGASESWTIEALINFQTAGDNEAIIANNGAGTEWWWRTDTTGNGLQFLFDDGPTTVIATHGTSLIDNNGWHHVALVFDRTASEVRTYYGPVTGGSLVGTTPFGGALGAIGDGTRDIEIGQFDLTSTRDFDGFIDRLTISNEVLGPDSFLAVVPEPSTLLLAAFGSMLFGATVRRRRRRS